MTKRPMVASVLLFTVTVLGVFTAISIVFNPAFLGKFFDSLGWPLFDVYSYPYL